MKDSIPVIYWTFRTAWTLLHFVIVAVAAAALLNWALADDHAVRAFEPARDNVLKLQDRVSNVIPWPWAAGGDGGDDSQTTTPSQGDSQTTAPSQNDSSSHSGDEYQVIGNVNVRAAPQLNAKVVKALADGSWIRINCITEGPSVDPGPYKTSLTAYQGQDTGATSKWDQVPGLGYISDAYVSTSDGGGLPAC